ncbi:hypothetical protein [Deminuibacter soli]|uniref:Uncharacterized protein n=1 Tax=Deminuibacter soli TaxID=2291815 RepID=A0A3E1NNJ3_9BACT|nr:hypothetical protein [Deminuibacter soli]RFM29501.1 hypothetical protein DXN05_00505 [Deminuibacter soli]
MPRLLHLIRKQWGDNKRMYVMGMTITIAIIAGIYFFNVLAAYNLARVFFDSPLRPVLYYAGLFIVGCIFAGLYFNDLSFKPRAITQLLLPASNTEKSIVAILFAVVLFFSVYTALFEAVDFAAISVAKALPATLHRTPLTREQVQQLHIFNMFDGNPVNNVELSIFFALQSLFLLGSVYFEKFGYIKTALSLIVIVLLFILYVVKLADNFLPSGGFDGDMHYFKSYDEHSGVHLIPIPWLLGWLMLRGIYILIAATWVTIWFRLKEKEV